MENDTSPDQLFRITTNRMYSALNAFYIWKWLNLAININTKGKEFAENNVSIINKYSSFFRQVILSVYKSFVADLAVFFDSGKYQDKFSLSKLLTSIKHKVSEKELGTLKKQIDKIKKKHGIKINLILELRNADVAHQEIKIQSRKINYLEMEELFSAVQEILDLLSVNYNSFTTYWEHIEEDVNRDMDWVFGNLEKGEIMRLREIDEKWGK